jgi:hypothetical protein
MRWLVLWLLLAVAVVFVWEKVLDYLDRDSGGER